jgi:regulator of replication initiation timing
MKDKWLDQLKTLQEQLETERDKLVDRVTSERERLTVEGEKLTERVKSERHRLVSERDRLVGQAKAQASRVRGESQERIWNLQTNALDQAIDLLDRVDELPDPVQKAAEPLDRLVRQRLEMITASPIQGYDSLNVRKVNQALKDLDWLDLVKVRRIESESKNRKTVLDGIDAALDRLQKAAAA